MFLIIGYSNKQNVLKLALITDLVLCMKTSHAEISFMTEPSKWIFIKHRIWSFTNGRNNE